MLFSEFDSKASFAATLKITVSDSSDCLSQRLVSLLYLNGLLLIVFICGSPFLGAYHFPIPLLRLEPEGLDTEVFLEGTHLPYGFSSTFQQVEFTTKPEFETFKVSSMIHFLPSQC